MTKIKDSGNRQIYDTGANRDNPSGKGMMNLIPANAILRVSRHFEYGGKKYGYDNWQKGIPNSRYVDAALRHLFKYLAGCQDEDHLSAAVWNVLCLMWNEEHLQNMQDIVPLIGRTSPYIYPLDYTDNEDTP